MRFLFTAIALGVASIFLATVRGDESTERKSVLAHYMPWFASKPVSGEWGFHWTMGRLNPDIIGAEGHREVAAHDHPLIGLYDSGDPDALECQVLLMKLAGIDGVIVDWYGIDDFNDYAMIHANTLALIPWLKRAGLKFSVCYEDQSIGHMVKGGMISPAEAMDRGKKVMRWLEAHWFSDEAYFRIDNRPLMLVFGPQYFDETSWSKVIGAFPEKPLIHVLPHLARKFESDGPFGWPPVTGGQTVPASEWKQSLEALAARTSIGESMVAAAFPGFRDFYEEAGLHESYGHIDSRGGKTLVESLELAFASDARVIQIATWNDYGEGTQIEPAQNEGYRYLEIVQERQKPVGKGSPYTPEDLRLPVQLYQLRKVSAGNVETGKKLDSAAAALFAGEIDTARKRFGEIDDQKEVDRIGE